MTTPLEHLKVWEGGGTTDGTVVDFISTDYLDKRPGSSEEDSDSTIVRGIATRRLLIDDPMSPLLQLRSTSLFGHLHGLEIDFYHDHEITILPCLDQIKRLEIWHGIIPAYSLNIKLPLVHTLQWLRLCYSTFSWMLGRTFKALKEFRAEDLRDAREIQSRHKTLQVDLSGCTTLWFGNLLENLFHCFSCPNVQILQWEPHPVRFAIDEAFLKSLRDFLCNLPCLRKLGFLFRHGLGLGSLIRFIFLDTLEQGVLRHIESAEVKVSFNGHSSSDKNTFFSQTVGHQQHYEKWWNEFTVTMDDSHKLVIVRASSRMALYKLG